MIPLAVVVIPFFSVMTRWGIPDAARVIVVFTVGMLGMAGGMVLSYKIDARLNPAKLHRPRGRAA